MNSVVLSKIINFLQLKEDPTTILRKYSAIARHILYTDPDIIKEVVYKMIKNIECWAINNSPVYLNLNKEKIYTKEDFLENNKWYVFDSQASHLSTTSSGSTTGEKFYYRITKKYHSFLEENNQYRMILREFNLPINNLKILSLIPLSGNPLVNEGSFGVCHFGPSKHAYHSHRSANSIRYFVDFSEYNNDQDCWHENLINYVKDKNLDVILSNAPIINRIKNYLVKNPINFKLCKLLSQTSQFPIKEDFFYLKENGYIEDYCDSMRCWDGGATFFTCKHGTYHLMDNLSYVREIDKKLVSTDYFSLPAPFINYWNGDYCEVEENYQKCKCQRWYRPFKMLQSRPFDLKGPQKLTEVKEKIYSLDFKHKIKQVQFYLNDVNIISTEKLNPQEKQHIDNILKFYNVRYSEIETIN